MKPYFEKLSISLTLLLVIIFFTQKCYAQTQSQTFSTPGTFTGVNGFTAPAGVTSVTVEAWGGGGAGGGGTTVSGGGGGGGAYTKVTNVSVIPGNSYTITVGAGGIGTTAQANGQPGFASIAILGTTVTGSGGSGGGGGRVRGRNRRTRRRARRSCPGHRATGGREFAAPRISRRLERGQRARRRSVQRAGRVREIRARGD